MIRWVSLSLVMMLISVGRQHRAAPTSHSPSDHLTRGGAAKRLRKRGDRMWLVPEAEGFPAIIVDEYVEVWGVVVALARRYRR